MACGGGCHCAACGGIEGKGISMAARYKYDSLGRKHDAKTGRLVASGKKKKAKKGGKRKGHGKALAHPKAPKMGRGKGGLAARVSRLEENQVVIAKVVNNLHGRVVGLEGAVKQMAGALGRRFEHKQLGAG